MADLRARPHVGGAPFAEASAKAPKASSSPLPGEVWTAKPAVPLVPMPQCCTAACLKWFAAAAVTAVLVFCLWIRSLDAQGMMLEIMVCEQKLFKELNITFYIDEGTLLGSVRDGGYFDEADREDTDWTIMSTDTDRLHALQHLSYERCGFPMIHRSDRAYLPYWLSIVCRRSAFRVFYSYWHPYFFLDIRDYDVIDNSYIIDLNNVDDLDTGKFPLERIFPLGTCLFEGVEFPCPKDKEWVVEEEYGADWRIRKRGFKTWMMQKSYKDEVVAQKAS